jgi:hypothetical protein
MAYLSSRPTVTVGVLSISGLMKYYLNSAPEHTGLCLGEREFVKKLIKKTLYYFDSQISLL